MSFWFSVFTDTKINIRDDERRCLFGLNFTNYILSNAKTIRL